MKKFGVLIILLNCCFALTLSLDQPSVYLDTDRGAATTHKVRLSNSGEDNLRLKIYAQDWQYTEDGAKEFLPAGSTPYSCANWLKLSAETLTIPANSSKEVTFELRTPKDAVGGHQAVIFFETVDETPAGQVSYGARLGTLVYQRTRKNTIVAIDPQTLKTGWQNNQYIYELAFRNNGNAWNSIRGSLALIEDGNVLEQIELATQGLLPGESAVYTGAFTQRPNAERVEVFYMLEDFDGALQTGQLLSADSAEAISRTQVWIESFDPVFNPTKNALQVSTVISASKISRVSPVVRIFNLQTNKEAKMAEFNPKTLRPYKAETLNVSWPIINGKLPPGEYKCVLNVHNGQKMLSEQKIVRIY